MAITFVDDALFQTSNGANRTTSLPGGLAEGDWVYMIGGHPDPGQTAGVSTAGWNLIEEISNTTVHLSASRKLMGATPDSSATALGSGDAEDATCYYAIAFRGMDQTTPEDAAETTATGSSSAPDCAVITTVTDGAVVIACGMGDNSDSTVTPPTSYTEGDEVAQVDTNSITTAVAYRTIASAGSENPGAFSGWTTPTNWACITIAIRPAGGGGGGLTIPIAYPHYMKLWAA